MPSQNDLEFELLLEALEGYQEAKAIHDKARGEYSGHSWGYAGADLANDLDRARANFRECLRVIIRSEIAAELARIREIRPSAQAE